MIQLQSAVISPEGAVHELSITDQLLQLALRHAEDAGASKIVRLHLVIGEFSSVVDESLQFYWDMMAENTIADHAELCFKRIPGEMTCADCGHTFLFAEFEGQCSSCGGLNAQISDGKQFRLESIEIEGPNDNGTH